MSSMHFTQGQIVWSSSSMEIMDFSMENTLTVFHCCTCKPDVSSPLMILERNGESLCSFSLRSWHTLTYMVLVLLLLVTQKMRHKICGSLLHVQIFCQNAFECSKWDLQLISQLRDSDASVSLAGFLMHATFLCVLLGDEFCKCLLSATDVTPLLNFENQSDA